MCALFFLQDFGTASLTYSVHNINWKLLVVLIIKSDLESDFLKFQINMHSHFK